MRKDEKAAKQRDEPGKLKKLYAKKIKNKFEICVKNRQFVLKYFEVEQHFFQRIEIVDGTPNIYHDRVVQYQLKSMQVITEESMSFKRRRLMSIEERAELSMNEVAPGEDSPAALEESDNQTTLNQFRYPALLQLT
ncbi:hypothetical protein ANCDUO_07386 [Ancylostoma duodenale]|uniref:Uncharacterized protein n=1 Tax=Ancylostoma duodenale TaxID=51022 RepID=A0A0C2CZ68_9BILA|nr:hypothetical protein ANCDUO_07386 [Ancylostoma duodenale]